jgi:SAM-dependent methyltransferase
MTEKPRSSPPRPSGLHSVDPRNSRAARLAFLDAENAKPAMRLAKQRSLELLDVRSGSHVLDAGCGPGDDARALAAMVGGDGRVLGVDIDAMMIEEAVRRSAAAPSAVTFRVGDVYALDEPDAAFDGCRAERVFLHLADPAAALAELARMVKPGGRIVVIDRDIETRTIDAPDRAVTRRIVNFWCDSFLGGWVGRALPRLFREAGLLEVSSDPFTTIDTDHAAFNAQYDLPRVAAQAEAAGAIGPGEGARWIASIAQRAASGSFFSSMTSFVVAGRKP